jgi:hypothetical protein
MPPENARGRPSGNDRPTNAPRSAYVVPTVACRSDMRSLAAAMLEDRGPDSLDAHVRALMKDLGLWGYHSRISKGSEPGWPDWVIIGHRILYRELKTEHGTLSPEQRAVGARITRAGGNWAVWRPRDLLNGTIAGQLAECAAIQPSLFAEPS